MSRKMKWMQAALGAGMALAAGVSQADSAQVTPPGTDITKPGAGAMVFDLLIGRPLGLAATATGSVLWVVGLPVEAMSGSVHEAGKRLVAEPARFTFGRPLGEMN